MFALHLHTVGFVFALLGAPFGVGLPVGVAGSSLYVVLARRELLKESWLKASLFGLSIAAAYVVLFFIAYISFVILLLSVAPQWAAGVA